MQPTTGSLYENVSFFGSHSSNQAARATARTSRFRSHQPEEDLIKGYRRLRALEAAFGRPAKRETQGHLDMLFLILVREGRLLTIAEAAMRLGLSKR